ncbi:hypothetical protein [Maribacter sp. 4G9]|uniref:hypothetical protein n=1 Tax=Maribacter sp. 4G9 TaxID=1889777 RepID=UPI000F50462A|nr:hypothetical protein [Maribacter sp. 4G9]
MRKKLVIFLFFTILLGCTADSDLAQFLNSKTTINLIFPENNSECKEGIALSASQTELTFLWEDNSLAEGYLMTLTNLNSREVRELESNEAQLSVVIERETSYSWKITSVSNPDEIRSATWSFFNEGPALDNSPPSPATPLSPVTGASISATSTTVNLRWNSEDPDNDIIAYDLYFGEDNNPGLFDSDLENDQYLGIPVSAGKTYYWKIVTKDSKGNESISPVFSFTVG